MDCYYRKSDKLKVAFQVSKDIGNISNKLPEALEWSVELTIMVTNLSLKAQLQDCDRRILLNYSMQEAIVFVRNGSRDSADTMIGLKSEMRLLQIERAEVQSEVVTARNELSHPTVTI